ncbi:MAG: hypothetical protein AAF593_04570 [Planctomycetota bacterium]
MSEVKSTISPGYRWRLILITLIMLGFGAYCVYDWRIGYPLKVEKYETYNQIMEDNPNDYPTVWTAYAAEKGWPDKVPGRKTSTDVFTQLLMALITVPLGLFFLFKLVKENTRWVAMDDNGITASGGHTVPWESIKSLDETKWKTKGIAYLHYAADNNRERKILLDDFKQEREPTKQIVTTVQELLNPAAPDEAASQETTAAEDGESSTAEPAVAE